jgi:2-iminobutanoate/2-iminopropanoate deaminase
MIPRKITLILTLSVLACQSPPPDRETLHSQLPERPYSGVVRVGDTYYFSGKVGATDETRVMTEGRVAAEVRNTMDAFGVLLGELGLEFADVVQANVFLADIDDYAEMNGAYGGYFTVDPPARTTVEVSELPFGATVEIAFTAVRTAR